MNTITNRFQVEELEQRLEMAEWSASAQVSGSATISSNGTGSVTGTATLGVTCKF